MGKMALVIDEAVVISIRKADPGSTPSSRAPIFKEWKNPELSKAMNDLSDPRLRAMRRIPCSNHPDDLLIESQIADMDRIGPSLIILVGNRFQLVLVWISIPVKDRIEDIDRIGGQQLYDPALPFREDPPALPLRILEKIVALIDLFVTQILLDPSDDLIDLLVVDASQMLESSLGHSMG